MATTLDALKVFQGHKGGEVFDLAVTLNLIPHWENITAWSENPSVGTTQEEMWNGTGIRTLPSTAAVISVVSSSAEDGAGTLTGGLTMRIFYLDENWDQATEDITLNGLTPVTTSGTAIRLQEARLLTAGSTEHAVGNIDLSIGGVDQGHILAGQSETRNAGFSVPRNHIFIPKHISVVCGRAGTNEVDFATEVREFNSSCWVTTRSIQVYEGVYEADDAGIVAYGQKSDVRVLATATGGSGVSAFVRVTGFMVHIKELNIDQSVVKFV